MSRATAATRSLEAFLVAGLLLGCPLATRAQSAPAPAGDAAFDGSWLELATEGTTDHFQPRATFRLDRAAYVAVFEVEPGVGATLLYPHGADRQVRLPEGEHGFRLNGVQQAFNRRMMLAHLSQAFTHRDPVVPYNHLVAVGSTRPLELDGLLSGRIFAYTRGFAGVEEVTGALLAEVLGERTAGEWTIARTSYLKFRSEPLLFAFRDLRVNAPFLVLGTELQLLGLEADPRISGRVTCVFGQGAMTAFFRGLGAVGLDRDCYRRHHQLRMAGMTIPPRRTTTPDQSDDRTGQGETDPDPPVLTEDQHELLAEIADARRSLGPHADEELEHLGVELHRAGTEMPIERMRRLRAADLDRARAATRARAERLRRAKGHLPGRVDRHSGPGHAGTFSPRTSVGNSTGKASHTGTLSPAPGRGSAGPKIDPPNLPERESGGG